MLRLRKTLAASLALSAALAMPVSAHAFGWLSLWQALSSCTSGDPPVRTCPTGSFNFRI